MNRRAEIRARLKAALTWLNTTTTSITSDRYRSLTADQLPALSIHTSEEQLEYAGGITPRQQRRDLDVSIEGITLQGDADSLPDAMDTIATEVERRMGEQISTGLNGLVSSIEQAGTTLRIETGGDKPLGIVSLSYTLTYYTAEV